MNYVDALIKLLISLVISTVIIYSINIVAGFGRDVSASNDDMAGDCRVHGLKIFYTTDASNDA